MYIATTKSAWQISATLLEGKGLRDKLQKEKNQTKYYFGDV